MNNSTNLIVLNQRKRKRTRGFHLLLLFITCFIGQVSFAQFPSSYCDVEGDDVEEITQIRFAGLSISNSNDDDLLIDRTTDIANIVRGQSYSIEVEGNVYGDIGELVAFIDWNQNGVLDDAGEVFYLGVIEYSWGDDDTVVSFTIPVPATASLGQTRIRVTKTWTWEEYGATLIQDPCFISIYDPDEDGQFESYGQAIDFTLNITDGSTTPVDSVSCEIEINLTFPEYGDVTTWKLMDADGTVVLRGGPYYGYEFEIQETYYGLNHPYSLQIDIDDTMYEDCDNEVQYEIIVGGAVDQTGTVTVVCGEDVTETVTLGACPAGCMKPGGLTKTNFNQTGFTLSWLSSESNFEILYGPLGFDIEGLEGTLSTNIRSTSHTYTNLNNTQIYEFYVRSACSTGDSEWARPLVVDELFVTPSPWHEDFEETEDFPLAWHPLHQSEWEFDEIDEDHGTSLSTVLYDYGDEDVVDKASFSTITVGPIQNGDVLSFNYLLTDWYGDPAYEGLGNVVVQLSTDFGSSYSSIATIESDETEGWQNFSFDLEDYIGLYVKIKIEANVEDIDEDFFVVLDDFDISNTINCKEITSAEIELEEEELKLNIESEATAFIIEYGLAGFEQGEGTTVNNVTSPYTFTDLEVDTDYEAYVQALPCGDWYGPVVFSTLPLAEQVITVEDITKGHGEEPFAHGTSSSGLPLSYVVEDPTIAIFQNGKFTIKKVSSTEVTASQAGNSAFQPAEDVTFTLTITPAVLTVTANEEQSKQYSQADPVFSYEVTGFKYNDTASVVTGALSREPGEEMGDYAITLGTLTAEPNYTITLVSADFSIEAKEIIVKANAQQKEYGEIAPALSYEVIGLEEGVLPTSVVGGTLTRVAGEEVGNYAIQVGSLEVVDEHYIMTFQESQLRIYPAVLSVYPASGAQKVYGQADPVFDFTVTGFKFNDTRAAVLSGRLGRITGENVAQYMYTQGSLGTTHGNYSFTVANQEKFKITPATLHVVVNQNQSKPYGQADPVLTYTLNGLMLGDHQANATRGSLVREAGEELGIYAIHQGSLEARSNYVIGSFVGADFEIKQSQITGGCFAFSNVCV
ncbi:MULTISPECIES: MBG domain-containing protein [unclassified Myroides]|uniref:MBG domain-containing protein n=1 Tax=unclassified Myroides TaxID=2642485 RepID=UPI003D2F9B75